MAWTPLLLLCLTLLGEQLNGHPLSPNAVDFGAAPLVPDGASANLQANDERETLARALMDSIARGFSSPGFSPARGSVSCQELPPMQSLRDRSPLARDLMDIALVLALGGLGCRAEPHILELYGDLGVGETNDLFQEILAYEGADTQHAAALNDALSTADREGVATGPALSFNVDQLAAPFRGPVPEPSSYHCTEFTQVNGLLLVGSAHSYHVSLAAAASECRRLGVTCAGIATIATGQFQVLGREGSYFLPHPGALSWLHHCEAAKRVLWRRSIPVHCHDQQELEVHEVMQWVPLASTYYNLGTIVYYASQNCTQLAKERALEAVIDLGYDAVVALTGSATGLVGWGVAAGLKPGVKAGVRSVIDYFRRSNSSDQ